MLFEITATYARLLCMRTIQELTRIQRKMTNKKRRKKTQEKRTQKARSRARLQQIESTHGNRCTLSPGKRRENCIDKCFAMFSARFYSLSLYVHLPFSIYFSFGFASTRGFSSYAYPVSAKCPQLQICQSLEMNVFI